LLRPEFPYVNHKRVYRLYRDANLAVRCRKKVKRPLNEGVPLQLAQIVNVPRRKVTRPARRREMAKEVMVQRCMSILLACDLVRRHKHLDKLSLLNCIQI